jgi:hypothetical protein
VKCARWKTILASALQKAATRDAAHMQKRGKIIKIKQIEKIGYM